MRTVVRFAFDFLAVTLQGSRAWLRAEMRGRSERFLLKWQGLRDFGLSSSGGEEEAENLSATAGPSRPERPSLAPSPGGSPEPSLQSPGASHHLRARRPQTPSGGAGGVCEPPPGLPRSPGRKPFSFPPFSFRSANPEMQGGLAWWKGCGFGGRAVPIQAL